MDTHIVKEEVMKLKENAQQAIKAVAELSVKLSGLTMAEVRVFDNCLRAIDQYIAQSEVIKPEDPKPGLQEVS